MVELFKIYIYFPGQVISIGQQWKGNHKKKIRLQQYINSGTDHSSLCTFSSLKFIYSTWWGYSSHPNTCLGQLVETLLFRFERTAIKKINSESKPTNNSYNLCGEKKNLSSRWRPKNISTEPFPITQQDSILTLPSKIQQGCELL